MSALPSSPDLSFEKKHAKSLLRDFLTGDPAAVGRVRAQLPRIAPGAALTLADAQLVVARERGFDSWPKLKHHIESTQSIDAQAERFLEAIREDRAGVVERLLGAHPDLARYSIHTASATGDVERVATFIGGDASLVTAGHGDDAWPPLAYACRSPLHAASLRHADRLLRTARLLLDAGADPNSGSVWHEAGGDAPNPVLYHACMSDHVGIVKLLLERGARPNDGESIYHAAQYNRRACLDLLLAFGGDVSSRQRPYGNTPLYFLAGHNSDDDGAATWFQGFTWLLEHGANPNVTSYDVLETPLHRVAAGPRRLATARLLIAHDADVNQPRADGRTPYVLAVRHGNSAVADLLASHGANVDVPDPTDAFLGACLAADAARAQAMLTSHPRLIRDLGKAGPEALADAVRWDRADAMRLMVDLGFSLSDEEGGGGTPLHDAAWLGRVAIVRQLLALGADVNRRDRQYRQFRPGVGGTRLRLPPRGRPVLRDRRPSRGRRSHARGGHQQVAEGALVDGQPPRAPQASRSRHGARVVTAAAESRAFGPEWAVFRKIC